MKQPALAALALACLVLLPPNAQAEDVISSDDILKQLDKKPEPQGGASRSFRGIRINTTQDAHGQPAQQQSTQQSTQQTTQQKTQQAAQHSSPQQAAQQAPSVTVYLYFRSGSAELADDFSRRQLAALGKALAAMPGAHFEIGGHTDAQGSDSANQLLSEQRADAIRQQLVAGFGLKAENISVRGYGESQPVADNDTEAGRAKNRRVVIKRLN